MDFHSVDSMVEAHVTGFAFHIGVLHSRKICAFFVARAIILQGILKKLQTCSPAIDEEGKFRR